MAELATQYRVFNEIRMVELEKNDAPHLRALRIFRDKYAELWKPTGVEVKEYVVVYLQGYRFKRSNFTRADSFLVVEGDDRKNFVVVYIKGCAEELVLLEGEEGGDGGVINRGVNGENDSTLVEGATHEETFSFSSFLG